MIPKVFFFFGHVSGLWGKPLDKYQAKVDPVTCCDKKLLSHTTPVQTELK